MISFAEFITEKDRCWPGYKPTPGKKAYSQGSCVKEDEQLEEKRGLWDNIHARRKKGLPPKKPGQEGYPKTLNIEHTEDELDEATFQGKEVALNKPMKGDVKKSKVYVDPDGDGKAQKVNFGDPNLSIKKDQPARKKSYCARSGGIKGGDDKTSANYWSRRAWNC